MFPKTEPRDMQQVTWLVQRWPLCRRVLSVVAVTILSMAAVGRSDPAERATLRTNLLAYRSASGALLPVRSISDWELRRAAILAAMQTVMGPLPGDEKRCALDARVIEETDCGSYLRRLISYASEPNRRVPAYLLVPKTALNNRAPAVLALHQTRPEGHKVVVGLARSPNDEYGVHLAERGYVVLAPPYPLLADYHPDLKALGYASGTMKAIWDNMRGLDFLSSLPFVKTNGFGAIGHSLGGHNGLYTAALDGRIKVVVSSCGMDSFVDYMDGNIKGWTSERYMPKLWDYQERMAELPFDFHEIIGAIAPRVCFISAPLGDTNFKWRSVHAVAASAAPVYRLYGVPNHLHVKHPDVGHVFPKEIRDEAYRLLDATLK